RGGGGDPGGARRPCRGRACRGSRGGLGRLLLAGRRCVRRGLRLACGGGRRGLRRPEVRLGGRFDGQRSPAPARARRRGLVGPGLVGLTRRGGVLLGGGAGGG